MSYLELDKKDIAQLKAALEPDAFLGKFVTYALDEANEICQSLATLPIDGNIAYVLAQKQAQISALRWVISILSEASNKGTEDDTIE